MGLRPGLAIGVLALCASVAAGSQIASKSLASVSNESAMVVVGVVERLERVSSSKTEGDRVVAHVRVVANLRGSPSAAAFKLPLHVGGLRGFDTELAEGDQAVFFLRSIESGQAVLHTWGSVARLPSGYFHVD